MTPRGSEYDETVMQEEERNFWSSHHPWVLPTDLHCGEVVPLKVMVFNLLTCMTSLYTSHVSQASAYLHTLCELEHTLSHWDEKSVSLPVI